MGKFFKDIADSLDTSNVLEDEGPSGTASLYLLEAAFMADAFKPELGLAPRWHEAVYFHLNLDCYPQPLRSA